jgi:hypothetical protein
MKHADKYDIPIVNSFLLTVCKKHNKKTKLRGSSPQANYTERTPLVGEVGARNTWNEKFSVLSV